MAQKKSFIKQFIKEKKMIGAVTPSSRFLAKKMLEDIDFNTVEAVVELGPGTGVFTRRILEKLPKNAKLFVFELNEEFYNALKNCLLDDRVILINDSAEKVSEYLAQYGFKSACAVISSLPLANFSDELRSSVLRIIYDCLKIEGKYIQFQYTLQAKKYITSMYKEMNVKFSVLNIPPAFVYTCTKA